MLNGLPPMALASGALVTWLVHVLISSVVYGLVWSLILRLVSHLGTGELVLLAAVVIGGLFLWARSRDRRRL